MHDSLIHTIFYIFAGLAVLSAFMVITQSNPVRCVLYLVLTFFASAVLWLLAEAEFLALILVLVYVGAVMTLFLFVVMMLNIDVETKKAHVIRYMPFGLIIVALLTGLLMISIPPNAFKSERALHLMTSENAPSISNTEALGNVLYTDYFLAFELAAVLLLVAIVASITLVHRNTVRSKRQNVRDQIMTRPKDRVRLVSIKSEKLE